MAAICGLASAGCQGEAADFDGQLDPVGPSLRTQLQRRTYFVVAPLLATGEGSYLTADVSGDLVSNAANLALPAIGGAVVARADRDGYLHIEDFSVDLSDVAMGPEAFPPRGLVLTGMQLRLAEAVSVRPEWGEDVDGTVAIVAEFDLLFDWAVVLSDGAVHPLATQRVRDIEFELEVRRRGAAQLEARISAHAVGHVWNWAQFVEVSNLEVAITALSDVAL